MRSTTVAEASVPTVARLKSAARVRTPKSKPDLAKKTGDDDGGRSDYEIRSVTRALDLLEAICESDVEDAAGSDEEVRVSCLSRRLGLSKSAVFRLLATFESRGYVERARETGIYRIGMNAYELGSRLMTRMGLLQQSRPVMEDLCRRCNEAVYLAIRRGSEFLFLDLVESANQVKIASLVGKRFPLAVAAPGQVLLAYSENTGSQTKDSIISEVHYKGYHHEQGGLGEMVSCLAAPFFDSFGTIAGTLCVVGPSFRMLESQIDTKFWPLLKDASGAISSKLGYLKPYAGSIRL